MSVIVQDEEGKLLLFSKGADRSVGCQIFFPFLIPSIFVETCV